MCTYIYISKKCLLVCECVSVCVRVYICLCMYMNVFTSVYFCVCLFVPVGVCMHVCVCVAPDRASTSMVLPAAAGALSPSSTDTSTLATSSLVMRPTATSPCENNGL